MKRVISALLIITMMCSILVACGKPELVKIDTEKLSSLNLVLAPNAEPDMKAFAEAYNNADVIGKADEGYNSETDVLLFIYTTKEIFPLFYLGENEFAVFGTFVDTAYVVRSEELATLYDDAINPKAKFVEMDADKVASVNFTLKEDAEADVAAFVEAYNDAEFIGNADKDAESSSDVMHFIYENSEAIFAVSYMGDDEFKVEGTLIDVDYTVKSAALAELYNKTVYPDAEFVALDEAQVESVMFTLDSEATGDAAAFAKAYNEAEFLGNVGDEKATTDVFLIFYSGKSSMMSFSYVEGNKFIVSGSLIERDYVSESEELVKLYNEAMGK